MAGFNKIVIKAGDGRVELDIATAQNLMMKLEEVFRTEHDTIDFPTKQANLNYWLYFPSRESITIGLVYIPIVSR